MTLLRDIISNPPSAYRSSFGDHMEVVFKISKNATLGETNYLYHNQGSSVVLYDTTSHADTGNADYIYAGQVGANGNSAVNLKELNYDFFAGESITIFAEVVSGAASNVTVSLVWKEDL